jgi:hypothetical protein
VNANTRQDGGIPYLSLGFGSFQFQITREAPEVFTGLEYLGWVEDFLRRLPTSTVIEVSADELFERAVIERPELCEPYRDRGLTYPNLEFAEIKFTLHLPRSLQAEVTKKTLPLRVDLGEDFVICTRDGWQMPTTAVWALGCRDSSKASEAVRVIREYMRWEARQRPAVPVEFDILGPSPAHFTVQLEPGKSGQSELFELLGRRTEAYEHYAFAYDPSLDEPAAAVAGFHEALVPELDFLYRLNRASAHRGKLWNRALMETDEILSAYRATGPTSFVRRASQGGRIKRSMIDLAEMALAQTQEIDQLETEFTTMYEDREVRYIKMVLQDEMRGFQALPTAPLLALLERFDARRQAGRGIVIAAVASLIGAVVAAVATLIASGSSS